MLLLELSISRLTSVCAVTYDLEASYITWYVQCRTQLVVRKRRHDSSASVRLTMSCPTPRSGGSTTSWARKVLKVEQALPVGAWVGSGVRLVVSTTAVLIRRQRRRSSRASLGEEGDSALLSEVQRVEAHLGVLEEECSHLCLWTRIAPSQEGAQQQLASEKEAQPAVASPGSMRWNSS